MEDIGKAFSPLSWTVVQKGPFPLPMRKRGLPSPGEKAIHGPLTLWPLLHSDSQTLWHPQLGRETALHQASFCLQPRDLGQL